MSEPTSNPQIHIQSNEVKNPDDAYEICFHKMADGTLFIEWFNSKELTDAELPPHFQATFDNSQLDRLRSFLNNPKTY
jgi:hypothetical protein